MSTAVRPGSIVGAHETYASIAEHAIREMILSGQLLPGARINEVELSVAFEISRGPLREALQRLIGDGLVVVQKHRGAFVKIFDEAELEDLYSLRIGLELWAIQEAARKADDAQLAVLTEMLSSTRAILEDDGGEYPRDLDFHRQLVSLAAAPSLVEAHESVLRRIQLARTMSSRLPARAREAVEEHQQVVGALLDGRMDVAITHLEAHLRASLSSARSSLHRPLG